MRGCDDRRATAPAAGFTLVEIMVAAAILLMAMGALLLAFVQAKQSGVASANRLEAAQIARNELEWMRAIPYGTVTGFGPRALSNTGLTSLSGTVESAVSVSSAYRQITVTVRWAQPRSTGRVWLTQQAILAATN